VLLLHGTGGTGQQFLRPQFADELFGPGQPLDLASHYVVLIDDLGHGGSSKPSDGRHARFPRYDYADMVELEHRLMVEHLGVKRVRLVLGTSMGCMHAFMWGVAWPDDAAALLPLACAPTAIAGRNRVWRKMVIEAIRHDPDWKGGDYTTQPLAGLRTAADLLFIAGSAAHQNQRQWPDRASADAYVDAAEKALPGATDANDLIYQLDASRTYDPSPDLEKIRAPLVWVNSADDFINPPELMLGERFAPRLKTGRYVNLPISDLTHGHGTHTWAAAWKPMLVDLLARTEPRP
jgi:homoserine O-acetyltransferase